jgi:hypothetical protein
MDLRTAIKRADLVGNGKSRTLDVTSSRYIKFRDLANLLQDDWLSEPGVQWNSRYQRLSLGNITSDRVTLDDTIYEFSKRQGDFIIIRYGDGESNYSRWNLVDNETFRLQYSRNVCTIIGDELVFNRNFASGDLEYDGEVIVPVYIKVDELVNPTDTLQVDDPNWLVYMMAAEFARNTVTKVQNYPALIQKANNLMLKMKEKNGSQIETIAMYPSAIGDPSSGYFGTFANSYGQPIGDD